MTARIPPYGGGVEIGVYTFADVSLTPNGMGPAQRAEVARRSPAPVDSTP
jgi:hypothetical protein